LQVFQQGGSGQFEAGGDGAVGGEYGEAAVFDAACVGVGAQRFGDDFFPQALQAVVFVGFGCERVQLGVILE
jgi:hypothetical protein